MLQFQLTLRLTHLVFSMIVTQQLPTMQTEWPIRKILHYYSPPEQLHSSLPLNLKVTELYWMKGHFSSSFIIWIPLTWFFYFKPFGDLCRWRHCLLEDTDPLMEEMIHRRIKTLRCFHLAILIWKIEVNWTKSVFLYVSKSIKGCELLYCP